MVTKTIKIQAETKDAQNNIKAVTQEIKNSNDAAVKATKSQSDLSTSTSALDKATGGLITKLKGTTSVLSGVTAGFRTMRGAIISTGIGALVIGITSLVAAFKASEEGQNKFNKLMGIIGVVTGNVVDIVADLGEKIIGVFENPRQAYESFKQAILDNLTNRFNGLLELIPNLGKAIEQLFKGNFSEAGTIAANAVGKVALGVEDVVGKTQQAIQATKDFAKTFVEETEREIKAAQKIADQRATADKAERDLILARAEANREIARLREIAADKENVSVEERLAALREAARVNDEISKQEIEAARLRFEAKQAENALSKSTKADLDEEAQLRARLVDLETNRLNTQKRLTAEITSAIREEEAERKRIEAERLKEQEEAEKTQKEKEEKARQEKLEAEKRQADAIIAIEKSKQDAKKKAVDAAIGLFGAETAAGKAALIAKQFLVAQEFILDAKAQIQKAKKAIADVTITGAEASTEISGSVAKAANTAPPPFNIPFILTAIATGASIIAGVKSAIGATKQAASAVGGTGGGGATISTPTPPQINTVGSSGVNQLAEVISGQNQQPVKAYVVAGDVTTAQSLERNTVKEASI